MFITAQTCEDTQTVQQLQKESEHQSNFTNIKKNMKESRRCFDTDGGVQRRSLDQLQEEKNKHSNI